VPAAHALLRALRELLRFPALSKQPVTHASCTFAAEKKSLRGWYGLWYCIMRLHKVFAAAKASLHA